MANHYFHFTIGPVQGFVAQARRTRDFWTGSFILSWLSAVAMLAVRQQGGTILHVVPWFQPGNPSQYEAIFVALGFEV